MLLALALASAMSEAREASYDHLPARKRRFDLTFSISYNTINAESILTFPIFITQFILLGLDIFNFLVEQFNDYICVHISFPCCACLDTAGMWPRWRAFTIFGTQLKWIDESAANDKVTHIQNNSKQSAVPPCSSLTEKNGISNGNESDVTVTATPDATQQEN